MTDTYALQPLDYDVWLAVTGSRLSQNRVDRIVDALVRWRRLEDALKADLIRERQKTGDLKRHLADRDAHIKNLEAQLRPMLQDHTEQTEAML